jgi:hypothetical protein
MKIHLPLGGIAIPARSGAGKSSSFFGSDHVRKVLIADPGSMGHKLYHKGNADEDIVVLSSAEKESPIQAAIRHITAWRKAGSLFVFDSFSAIQEMQCAWWKRMNKPVMSQRDYMAVVGDLRDLNLCASGAPGFTLFNTSPGGMQIIDGKEIHFPKGSLVGFPALNGVGPNSETILSRWTCSWVIFPGAEWKGKDGQMRNVPRGFIPPNKDLRGAEVATYTPIKDPYGVIEETMAITEGQDVAQGVGVHEFPPFGGGKCIIDLMLEKIATKFPVREPAQPATQQTAAPGKAGKP